jgi:hypothetical protein
MVFTVNTIGTNHVYKSWYGKEPPLVLTDRLREYLRQ